MACRTVALGSLVLLFTPMFAAAQTQEQFVTRVDVPDNHFMISATVTVEGAANQAISVSGGRNSQYSINKGDFTNEPATVQPGQVLTLRHVSGTGSLVSTTTQLNLAQSVFTYTTVTAEVAIEEPPVGDFPEVSIRSARPIPENLSGGNAVQRFQIDLSRTHSEDVVVNAQPRSGTAVVDQDVDGSVISITIPAGQRRGYAGVPILDDALVEPDEDFQLDLISASQATINSATASARGLIIDDELAPGCNPLPAQGLCAGVAEGALEVPIGVPLGGYLRPPAGGEYIPGLEAFGEGDAAPFFEEFAGFIPETSEGGGANATPPNEARTSPYSTFSPSTRGYYDSLVTKVLALSQGGETVVFVKLDTIGMLDEIAVAVRAQVQQATGIDLGDRLIMSATHTHDGPGAIGNRSVKYFWAAVDAYHQDLFEKIAASIGDVVIEALQRQVPARMGYAFGTDATGANSFRRSRSPYTAERVAEQDALRKRIGVIRVDQVDASAAPVRPLAAMVNFSAHGIVFDVENLYFSGDALGGLERSLQSRFEQPVMVMHVQSAGGDVSPRADGSPKRQRIERFGEQVAPQVKSIYDNVNNFSRAPTMRVVSQRFVLNRQVLGYGPNEYLYEYGAVQCNADFEGSGNCVAASPNGADDEDDNGVAENDSFVPQDSLISVIQLGDAVLITQPGEPLAEQGLRLLERSHVGDDNTFIWGYALDHVGYILPDLKADWDIGGTEGTTTFWGWKQGGRMADIVSSLLDALENGTTGPADEFDIAYASIPRTDKTPSTSPTAGSGLIEPSDVRRFNRTSFKFEGGDPVVDFPVVTLEEKIADDVWMPVRRADGRVLNQFYEYWVDYVLTNGSHGYTIEFEPSKSFPLGVYRFRVDGKAAFGPGVAEYSAQSTEFEVLEAENLQLSDVVRNGDTVSATLSYEPVPNNYRLVDPVGSTSLPAPVREGSVTFALNDTILTTNTPLLSVENGRTLATYSVTIPGQELPTATGEDRWGNRTPELP